MTSNHFFPVNNSTDLQKRIQRYFEEIPTATDRQHYDELANAELAPYCEVYVESYPNRLVAELCFRRMLRSDVKAFLRVHGAEMPNARAVARIFHGIPSPAFTADVWAQVCLLNELYVT